MAAKRSAAIDLMMTRGDRQPKTDIPCFPDAPTADPDIPGQVEYEIADRVFVVRTARPHLLLGKLIETHADAVRILPQLLGRIAKESVLVRTDEAVSDLKHLLPCGIVDLRAFRPACMFSVTIAP